MMAEKKYFWLKLKKDFFTSKEMKKLRKIAGGDTYTIIYLKLQLLSLQDEGKLFFDGIEETFAEELALTIDEEPNNVQATMLFLQKCGLVEIVSESEILLSDVPSLIGSESEAAERMRKIRAAKQNAAIGVNTSEQSSNIVQQSSRIFTEIEKEKEKDLETEREKRKRVTAQQVVDLYNETCVSFPSVRSVSDARKKAIKARLNIYSLDDFRSLFEKAEASSFLRGGNERNWQATFDWLIKDSNMAKVLDGNYDDKSSREKPKSRAAAQLDDSYRMIAAWAEGEDDGETR